MTSCQHGQVQYLLGFRLHGPLGHLKPVEFLDSNQYGSVEIDGTKLLLG